MKKINTRFNFGAARNAEHYNLHLDILDTVTEAIAAAMGFKEGHSPYLAMFGLEQECFLKNRRYVETILIWEKNGNRMAYFAYLAKNVATARNLPSKEMADAANRVYYLMEPYGNVARLNFASATARLVDLLIELRSEKYAADLEKLGMTETVEALYKENEEFRTIYTTRSEKGYVRHKAEKMTSIRPKVDKEAIACFEMINALYLLAYMNGDAEKMATLEAIIDKINALMLELQKTLARSGVAAKPGSEEEDDDIVTGDDTTEKGDSSTDEGSGESTPDTGDSEGGTNGETSGGNEGGTTPPPTTDGGDDDGEVVG